MPGCAAMIVSFAWEGCNDHDDLVEGCMNDGGDCNDQDHRNRGFYFPVAQIFAITGIVRACLHKVASIDYLSPSH